jgi:hypothetical protein
VGKRGPNDQRDGNEVKLDKLGIGLIIVTVLLAVVNLGLEILSNYACLELPRVFIKYPYLIWISIGIGLMASVVLTLLPSMQQRIVSRHDHGRRVPASAMRGAKQEEDHDYDVFVSYSHRDTEWVVESLISRLEKHGFRVLVDYRDFIGGDFSIRQMERAVLDSKRVLLVLTPDYVGSEWAEFENVMARTLDPAARHRKVIPLLRKDCDIPLHLRILHYRDLRHEDERQWQLLIRDLM